MKNKKVLIISSIIAVIAIAVVVIGVLYFTTDLFKTDRQLFYKYLSKVKVQDENLSQKCNVVNDKIIKNSSSSVSNIDISTLVQNQETGIADVQKILNIKSNGLKNVELKQAYSDFTISSNDQQLLTLKYIKDDNTYAIGADKILAKYLAVENSNLKDLFAKLGVEDTTEIPDSILTNYEELFKIDQTTLNTLKETYYTLIYNNIDDTHFYKMENEDGTNAIGLSLSEQEVYNLVKIILETAKNDTTLLNLIINKAQLIGYTNITIENIQTKIQEYIDNISNNTYSTDKDFAKISIIKKGKVVTKIVLETNYKKEQTADTVMYEEETNQTTELVKYSIEIDISENNKFSFNIKENDIETILVKIDYSYNDNNINLNTELELKEGETSNFIKVQYQINNYQTDNITQNLAIETSSQNDTNYQINISNETTLKQDITIEKLTTENSAKLNDMSAEEINTVFTAIMARIMTLYGAQINTLSM